MHGWENSGVIVLNGGHALGGGRHHTHRYHAVADAAQRRRL